MRFELKAIGPGGSVQAIALQAPDQASAVRNVQGRGYTVLSVRAQRAPGIAATLGGARFPVEAFSQELRVLLEAGLPLPEAIETLGDKERRDDFRAILARVADVLREGRPLSAALEEFPGAFPSLYVATVKASEKTSDLARTLARYVQYAAQVEAVRRRVVNASIYPALLLVVGSLVTLFLLFYVVPRFAHIYQARGGALPFASRLLLAWGESVGQNGALLVGAAAGLAVLAVLLLRSEAVRGRIADSLWRLPALGERLKAYQLARFYRTVGMLLRGGMPLVQALDMGAPLLHPRLRLRLAAATRRISEGRSVTQSLDAEGLVTPVAARMLGVGERGGSMGEMLEQAAVFHDEEQARWVEWFTRLFEPLLMTLIGLFIGAIVVLMYLPIFELAGSVR